MSIDELINYLTLIRIEHGNLEVSKQVLTRDHYEPRKREVEFQEIEPMFGLMRQIVTVKHQYYTHRKSGEPITVPMKVDDESKARFSYDSKYIVAL